MNISCLVLCTSTMLLLILLSYPVKGENGNKVYAYIHLLQIVTCVLSITIGSFLTLGRLREIEQWHQQFKNEKRSILLTAVFFSIGYVIKIIFISLNISTLTFDDIAEFWAVQVDCFTAIFCEMMPLFYFVY